MFNYLESITCSNQCHTKTATIYLNLYHDDDLACRSLIFLVKVDYLTWLYLMFKGLLVQNRVPPIIEHNNRMDINTKSCMKEEKSNFIYVHVNLLSCKDP